MLAHLALTAGSAAAAPFDLAGPTLEVEVTRGGRTLPAAEVPNLAVGDHVWVKADLAIGGATHYLMVAAFLRGATDPPPEDWFFVCETWTRRCAKDGLTLTLPEHAQQLLVFLAPKTGGAYRTLVNAVRGRPGAFVRTSQDLNQAALDHARLDAYLAAIRQLGEIDPTQLKAAAPLLARSLAIKVDEACLEKISVLQAPCLSEGRESLILDDGHSASLARELTSGPASDLAMEASSAPQLKSGYYGPFIGSILDIAKILDSLHTAQYQYIPALTSGQGRQIALTLNAAPSFHDPKSVLVVALPPIEPPRLPAIRAVDRHEILCASRAPLVLPVQGAPMVFSTSYAHDSVLHVLKQDGSSLDLPATADPTRGGFVVTSTSKVPADAAMATLRGQWGFDHYEGPSFELAETRGGVWSLASGESPDLIVGRAGTIHLRAGSVSCLDDIALTDATAKSHKVQWKKSAPNELEVTLPLQEVPAGELTLQIKQFGRADVQTLSLHAFAQAGHLESFALHVGDTEGILRGNRLDEVKDLTFSGVLFTPGTLTTRDGHDELSMLAQSGSNTHTLKGADAEVTLKDGRRFDVTASIESPRPSAAVISKTVEWPSVATDNAIQLATEKELPLEARLTFSLRAGSPAVFTPDEKLEVATSDGSMSIVLGVGGGDVMLQSRKIAVITLDPSKALGPSAFGPLRFRRIVDGIAGEWAPLLTLVRLPKITGADCPAEPDAACSLAGSQLFLLDAVSADADFTHVTHVPDGFTEPLLQIPHPLQGRLYVKLRDDPAIIHSAVISVNVQPSASVEAASPGPEPLRPSRFSGSAPSQMSFFTAAPVAPPEAASAGKAEGLASQPPMTAAKDPPVHAPP